MSMPSSPGIPTPQHQILAASLIGGIVVIGVALAFLLPLDESPPLPVWLGLVVAGALVHLGIDRFGYRRSSPDPVVALQTGMILRSAFCEVIAIVSILLAFVLPEGGFATYGVGAGVAIALMGVHVWPTERVVAKQLGTDRA